MQKRDARGAFNESSLRNISSLRIKILLFIVRYIDLRWKVFHSPEFECERKTKEDKLSMIFLILISSGGELVAVMMGMLAVMLVV